MREVAPTPETTPVPAPDTGGQPTVEREFTVAERSQAQLVLRRFLQHRGAMISLVILVMVVLLPYVGGLLWHYQAGDLTPGNSQPPALGHPFGTEPLGQDPFAAA